jgi:hypothetical protein
MCETRERWSERRAAERRVRVSRFVWDERRAGFDRRGEQGGLMPSVLPLRSPAAMAALLAAINVLNLLDQRATATALAAGFSEGNPVMAALISADPRLAAVVKVAAVAGASVALWNLRQYRAILRTAVLVFAVFSAVLLWHVLGAALYL